MFDGGRVEPAGNFLQTPLGRDVADSARSGGRRAELRRNQSRHGACSSRKAAGDDGIVVGLAGERRMSDDRLARIETKLDGLSGTVESLAGTVATLVAGQAGLQTGQAKLEAGRAKLQAQVGTLEAGQAKLQAQVGTLGAGQAKLEAKVGTLEAGQAKLEAGQARLEAGQAKIEARVGTLETGQAKLEGGQARLEGGQAKIEAGQTRLEARIGTLEKGQAEIQDGQLKLAREVRAGQQQLHDQMLVLHEDVLDKLKALDPKPLIEATERKLTALIEERHEQVNRRLEPVERALARSLRRRGRPS
jgi:chromosome segregation ATPase